MFHTPRKMKTRGAIRREQCEQSSVMDRGSIKNLESCNTEANMDSQPAPSVAKTEGSVRSRGSTRASLEARKQELVLIAAAAKAAIEKDLIEKKLAADLAALEERTMSSEKMRSDKIEEWIDNSIIAKTAGSEHCKTRDVIAPVIAPERNMPTDIDKLATALHRAIVSSQGQTRMQQIKDLPSYSGDTIEWLHFKKAYDEAVDMCNLSESEKIFQLRRCLHGEAKEAVSSLLMCGATADMIFETLELRFGQPDLIIIKIVTQLKRMTALPFEYHKDIAVFATKVQNFVAVAHATGETDYLRSPELTATILSKLPSSLVTRWMDYLYDHQDRDKSKFELLSNFLSNEAVKVAKAGINYINNQPERRTTRPLTFSVHTVNDNHCTFCKMANHPLPECPQFKRAMRRDRWRFVRIHKLCHKCLTSRHDRLTCPAAACDIGDCRRNHHRLLHWSTRRNTEDRVERADSAAGTTTETVTTAIATLGSRVLLKVVPVIIHGPHKSVHTYALLDDGATVSLISEDIANEAELYGRCIRMRVRSAWETSELECRSELINCELSNGDGERFEIHARKINKLQLPVQSITNTDFLQLNRQLTNHKYDIDSVQPKVLIGQDNYHLLRPLECIRVHRNGPYVTRTLLGWSVHGAMHSAPGPERPSRSVRDPRNACPLPLDSLLHVSDSVQLDNGSTTRDTDQSLTELVRNSFALDSIGICNIPRSNKEEQMATTILTETAKLVNGQWEVGLPWRSDTVLPDSYPTAYRRLIMVEKKNINNPDYGSRYEERITHLFKNGYAREVLGSEPATRIWYLPHFAVDNPNKKKMRVVFDAAATSRGHSLNDYLLQGPDLLQSLLGIMFRFREGSIAMAGDIKDMFLRIKIRTEDQNALRFLWRNNNPGEPVKKYAMTSLIFGANCSPFIAQFVKNKNAERFRDEMPEAVNAIIKSHYMDDYIDSLSDVCTAKQLIDQITYIHKSGGFEMRNWSSNDTRVIEGKSKDMLSTAIEFKIDDHERTLGLLWFLASDTLCFDLTFKKIPADILTLKSIPTKRELLRIVMSIYDVYGLLAPVTVKAKILLRLVWQKQISWDMQLPGELLPFFNEWITQISEIKELHIPRWYFKSDATHSIEREETDIQLHMFCDASPSAYAAVGYWRKLYSDGSVCVSLIACKTRVASLKIESIPRLELQAALLACRLAHTITMEHRIIPNKKYYWCDSTTVLHWIKNENRNYNVFIANRLGEIDSLSNISEWHYVPTKKNIADAATKLNNYKLTVDSDWFRGPSFLYTSSADWPQQPVIETQNLLNDEIIQTIDACDLPVTPIVPDPNRFSSWSRLHRSTATVLLFIDICRRSGVKRINCDLLRKAEMLLLRYSQAQSFATEIKLLILNKNVANDSRLRFLTPFLDEDGLIRVAGRIDAAQCITRQVKQPIILDGRNRITRLLAKHYHEAAAHCCNEMVVNELRQRYWISGLRPTVRTVASQCMFCRLRKIKPKPPRMGNLPEARLMHHHRPFTSCGVDLFGPMDITVGRRRAKRYGVLFTCLTVRAIHIEVVTDLSTDTLIMALRRMSARRGWPVILFSDNGTNFRGAAKELKNAFAETSQPELQEKAAAKGVNWSFIPPGSPHMGGAWERLIRSVKTALRVVLKERAPREETLVTMLAEVEAMVNSRPLTHVSVDCHYDEALTPNHFLIGTSSPTPIPGSFDNNEFYLRRQWRIAQRLTDMFWQRWVKEVLPVLIPRTKWYDETEPLKLGDLVLICDPNLPRNTWPRGLIVKVHPGKDGRVRVVDVKTRTGTLTRPVTRVALFPTVNECLERSDGTRAENVNDVRDAL